MTSEGIDEHGGRQRRYRYAYDEPSESWISQLGRGRGATDRHIGAVGHRVTTQVAAASSLSRIAHVLAGGSASALPPAAGYPPIDDAALFYAGVRFREVWTAAPTRESLHRQRKAVPGNSIDLLVPVLTTFAEQERMPWRIANRSDGS